MIDEVVSNFGRWDPWYKKAKVQKPYGGNLVYELAADWLDGLSVEDWGCGYAWFKKFHRGPYKGIDGTKSKWCDIQADLTEYTSITQGIMLRGVLEHEPNWIKLLDNAVNSFTDRLFIALFTPMKNKTQVIDQNVGGLGVPDISFKLKDITDRLLGCEWTAENMATETAYGEETVLRITKL